jgi:hypothetical protein
MDSQADSLSALADQFMSSSNGSSRSRRKRAKKEAVPSSSHTSPNSEPHSAQSSAQSTAPNFTPNTTPSPELNTAPNAASAETSDQRVSKMQELRLKRFSQMQTETDNSAPNWSHLSNMESAIENLQIDAEKQDRANQQLTTGIESLENNAFSTPTVIMIQKTSLNSQNIRNQFRHLEKTRDGWFLGVNKYFSEYGEPFLKQSPDDKQLSNRKIALFERTEHLSVK